MVAPTPVIWANGISGIWQTASDWTPNTVPGDGNSVFITPAGTYTVTDPQTTTVYSIATAAGATLDITGGTFTTDAGTGTGNNAGNIKVESGATLVVLASTMTNTGTLTNSGTLDLNNATISGGALTNSGTLDATGGGTSVLSGASVFNGAVGTRQLFLDGNSFVNTSVDATSASVTLTTSNVNDVIILDILQDGTAVTSVSDAAGLVWHQRAVAGPDPNTIYEYYAIAPSALSADAITVNFAGASSYTDLNAFGVSGANLSAPFDNLGSIPATPAGGAGSISPSDDDFVFAGYRFFGNATPSAGSGWTAINASGGYYVSEYQIAEPQAGLTATASSTAEDGGIVDAISSAIAATTVDSGSTLDLENTTISGGSLINAGTVDVTGGGVSSLNGVDVTNTDGAIIVDAGSTLALINAMHSGGALTNFGIVDVTGDSDSVLNGASISNVDGVVTIDAGSTLELVDTLEVQQTVITGGMLNNSGTVDSTGTTALNGIAISNSNLIEAAGGTLTIDQGTVTNNGTLKSLTGATVDLDGVIVANTNGNVTSGVGSPLKLENTTITGGALINSGAVNVTGGGVSTFDSVNAVNATNSAGPIALDGSSFYSGPPVDNPPIPISGQLTSNASVTLTTANANDVIVLFVSSDGAPIANDGDDEYDADHLSWHFVAEAGAGANDPRGGGIYEYYAIAPEALSADVITVNIDGYASSVAMNAFAISNANTFAPFDTNASIPATSDASTVTAATSDTNDFIFAGYRFSSNATPGAGSGWTAINANGGNFLSEYQIADAPQDSVVAAASSADESGGIVDAVVQASGKPATLTVDAGATLDLKHTTITGGNLSNAGTVDVTGGGTSTLNGVVVGTSSLALDGEAYFTEFGDANDLEKDSASVTLTTTQANDVIILDVLQDGTAVGSVSDAAGLVWQQRAVAGTGSDTIYEYYAIAPDALSSDVITVNFAGTASYVDLNAFGVSGANTSSPFDSNVSVPATPASSTGVVTTSNANDLIVAGYRFGSDATPAAGTGWTAINASGDYFLSEYQVVSSAQAGLVATASTADQNGGIIDAIVQASDSAAGTLAVDTGSALDLNNTTITGGTLSNAGTVDVTGGTTSTLAGVGVTNTGMTVTTSTPLALDGNGFTNKSVPTTSASVSLTTHSANDVIILDIVQNGTSVSSVTDAAGLIWHQRAVAGTAGQTIYEYYAIAANALSSDAIIVNFAGAASYVDLNAFGVSGANTSSPFDSNVSVPASPAASTGSITTSNANDLIVAGYRFGSDATPAAGSGWTAINASGNYYLSEYQVVSSTQASLVATASTADQNGGVVDAIVQAPASVTTTAGAMTVDASSMLDLNNTTITGGALSNAGTVDVTGGATSTLDGVSLTNAGGSMTVTAPFGLDGKDFANKSTPTTSASVTLTTTQANDVIILDIVQNGTSVSSVTDAAGLIWHQRAVTGTGVQTIYEYYAIAPSALSADAITVNFAGAASYADLNAFAVSGANTSSPFDSNVSVPATPASSTGVVTTSNANDLIVAGYRFGANAAPAAGSGWTAINAGGNYYLSEYQIVSSTQAGLVATASTSDQNGGIVDAIVQAPVPPPTAPAVLTVDAGSTLDLNNTTITGGALNNAGTVDSTGTSAVNGATVTNSSLLEVTGGQLTINAPVSNIGNLLANNGATLDLTGAVTGNGTATISGTNSVLEFGAASAENTTFSAAVDAMLKLDNASGFTGTVAGLATGDSIDLTNFLYLNNAGTGLSGSPKIAGVVAGSVPAGQTTNVTVQDGTQSVTLELLNQYGGQFPVDPAAYTLTADNNMPNHGTLFQLAAGP
jgi:hypothetical protein